MIRAEFYKKDLYFLKCCSIMGEMFAVINVYDAWIIG